MDESPGHAVSARWRSRAAQLTSTCTTPREIGNLLPNNQRQHIQKDVLPHALC